MATNSYNRRKFLISATGASLTATGLANLPLVGKASGSASALLPPAAKPEQNSPEGQTWVVIENRVYGAKPDGSGPIGGGANYYRPVSEGDFMVNSLDEILMALREAKRGQVVFIPSETEIDLSTRIYIDEIVVEIP